MALDEEPKMDEEPKKKGKVQLEDRSIAQLVRRACFADRISDTSLAQEFVSSSVYVCICGVGWIMAVKSVRG